MFFMTGRIDLKEPESSWHSGVHEVMYVYTYVQLKMQYHEWLLTLKWSGQIACRWFEGPTTSSWTALCIGFIKLEEATWQSSHTVTGHVPRRYTIDHCHLPALIGHIHIHAILQEQVINITGRSKWQKAKKLEFSKVRLPYTVRVCINQEYSMWPILPAASTYVPT